MQGKVRKYGAYGTFNQIKNYIYFCSLEKIKI